MAQKRATSPGFKDARYRALIEVLRDRRKQLKISQEELARRLGLHKQFISRVETGERRLDVVEFADYSRALKISPLELVKSIGEPNPQ